MTYRIDPSLQLKLLLQRRLVCEPTALALAVPLLDDDDITDAERILVECELATGARKQVARAFSFYLRLMASCGDDDIINKVSEIQSIVLNSISEETSVCLRSERAQHQRWCLLEFCRRGDVEGAVNALQQSIEDDCRRLRHLLGSRHQVPPNSVMSHFDLAIRDFVDALETADDELGFRCAAERFAMRLGYRWFAYLGFSDPALKVLSSYPSSWAHEYLQNRYEEIDPVIGLARFSQRLFQWDRSRLRLPSPSQQRFFVVMSR